MKHRCIRAFGQQTVTEVKNWFYEFFPNEEPEEYEFDILFYFISINSSDFINDFLF